MRWFIIAISLLLLSSCEKDRNEGDWPVAGGDFKRQQFSTLSGIDSLNVSNLSVAWVYHTRDAQSNTQIQCNPIIIDGILYATSPSLKLFALNAATGEEIWSYNRRDPSLGTAGLNTNRGVAYWSDSKEQRIFYVVGPELLSIDAKSGRPDTLFGTGGSVDLREGLDRDVSSLYVTATSPGIIYKDLFILGSRVSESNPAAPGHIRAFDVRTGEVRWIFHTIPHPGETGYDSWEDSTAYLKVGGANSWSGLSLDTERGIVFAGTGSATFDFYGGDRAGDNLFANSVLALNAQTGEYKWHFQTIHHDVWDRDLPAPPVLATIKIDGSDRDVAIQATKTGYIFVLDRETGVPVYPVEEIGVPVNSELIGEQLSETQPVPLHPEPFIDQTWRTDQLRSLIPDTSYRELMSRIAGYAQGEIFTPPSERGTVFFPGLDGGAEWGGSSFDERTGKLYINANRVPWIITNLRKTGNISTLGKGALTYQEQCMSCHGKALEGAGNYPSLQELRTRMEPSGVVAMIKNGKGMMPSFGFLEDDQVNAVTDYVLNYDELNTSAAADEQVFRGYSIAGYDKLQTLEGLPAINPPWGTLSAIDIPKGTVEWSIPLGKHPALDSLAWNTGSENYGGPVATAGGVLFIASTPDKMFRAFRMSDGKMLWEYELPGAAFATPSVYQVENKEYVVIACGGGKLGTPSADVYMAFTVR